MGGCNSVSRHEEPQMFGSYQNGNIAQREYIKKLVNNFYHEKQVHFRFIKSDEYHITLSYKGAVNDLETEFIGTDESLHNTLNKAYKLLDK